jgi:hypothetical protein
VNHCGNPPEGGPTIDGRSEPARDLRRRLRAALAPLAVITGIVLVTGLPAAYWVTRSRELRQHPWSLRAVAAGPALPES